MNNEDIEQLTDLMLGDSIPKMLNIIHENKKLQKENNNLKTSLDESQEVVIDLEEELEEEKRINQEDLKYIDKLNERIEKAVEYINHLSKEPNVFGHYGINYECSKWLLKILRGGE